MKQLASRHEISLLSFIQKSEETNYIEELKKVCKEVVTVHLPTSRSIWNCVRAIPLSEPFQVAYFHSKRMKATLDDLIGRTKPDIIHTHLIRMAQYTAHLADVPKILDMTDAVSLYLSRFRDAQKNPLNKWLLGVELKRMGAYEAIISKFDRGLVCSHTDKNFLLQRNHDAHIDLLYNGVDLEAFSFANNIVMDPFRIIFTGNMSYFPNIDGARFLAKEIFPLVKKKIPQAKLFIVGQNPPQQVKSLANNHIAVTGFVEDIRTEYLKSTVAVSPVRFGAGTLNKVLEPLALGVPVVSTSIGLEGLGLNKGEDILIADDAVSFAEAIIDLLQNDGRRKSLATVASQKIRSRFGWTAIAQDLERIYEDAVQKRSNSHV